MVCPAGQRRSSDTEAASTSMHSDPEAYGPSRRRSTASLPPLSASQRSFVSIAGEAINLQHHRRHAHAMGQVVHTKVVSERLGHPTSRRVGAPSSTLSARPHTRSPCRLHDLRHTHATLALAANVHPKVVSERLGHAPVSITLDTYSHAIPAMQEEAAERTAGLVFAASE